MTVNLSLYLICHHGDWDDFSKDVEVVRRVSFEKGMPMTYFFSGLELDAIVNDRERIIREFEGFDMVGAIAGGNRFVDPRHEYGEGHMSELGIMPYNHIPLVHPFGQDMWGDYFNGFVRGQIDWSKAIASREFGKTPVRVHPPDGIYAPAAAFYVKLSNMDSVVISSETFDNGHDRGKMYWHSGLRHVVRTNEIQLQADEFQYANRFVDRVLDYANDHNIYFVTVGCDIDEFNGMRDLGQSDGIARLCGVGDAVNDRHGIDLVNVNASAHWNKLDGYLGDVWAHDDVYAMINREGNLDFMDGQRNAELESVIRKVAERHNEGWDVSPAKDRLRWSLDAACRNGWCSEALTGHYQGNLDEAKNFLGW